MAEDLRIEQIRAVLDAYYDAGTETREVDVVARITRIVDRPAPRVFFPGDTVPGGVWTVAEGKDGKTTGPAAAPSPRRVRFSPKVEVHVPSLTEWRDAVNRALAEREPRRG